MPWLAETEVGMELLGLTPSQIRRALAEKRAAEGRALLGRLTPPPAEVPASGDVS